MSKMLARKISVGFMTIIAVILVLCANTVNAKADDIDAWSAIFNAEYYAAHNPDLQAAGITSPSDLFLHFTSYGMKEGRQASEEFNVAVYISRYPDLQQAYGNNLENYYLHYLLVGKNEGRSARVDGVPVAQDTPVIDEPASTVVETAVVQAGPVTMDSTGVIVIGESHCGVIGLSKGYFLQDSSIVTSLPKNNYYSIASPSMKAPGFWGGGISLPANGRSYEGISYINEIMDARPDINNWYIVYFNGTNDIKIQGASSAMKSMKSDLTKLSTCSFNKPHKLAVITMPHFYGLGPSYKSKVNAYDQAEIEAMASLGLSAYCFDSRNVYSTFTKGGKLTGKEYSGYRYNLSGDGIHFYASQYWTVTAQAVESFLAAN